MAFWLVLLPALVLAPTLPGADWMRFRGPNATGVAMGPIVERPSLDENLLWKTPLPTGHSSPVISSKKIYVTAVENEKLYTLALERETGEILWRREAPRPRRSELHENNNAASPTPTSDGENVYVFFGDFGLLSYGPDGNERWRVPLGPFVNIRGMASSPVVENGKVFLLLDDDSGRSFLIAVDAETGRELWRADRKEFGKGFSTPTVYRPKHGPTQLIVPGSFALLSYSLETGKELWRVGGLCWQAKAVPLIDYKRAYFNCQGAATDAMAGRYSDFAGALKLMDANGNGALEQDEFYERRRGKFPEYDFSKDGVMDEREWNFFVRRMATRPGIFAVRLGGLDEVSDTRVEWAQQRRMGNVPSPLLYERVIYSVRDAGILSSIDAETGEILKQARLPQAMSAYRASPVAADGKLFLLDMEGTLTVVKAGGQWEVLHSLALDEGGSATPAIADGRLYVRTHQNLYCFGE